MLPSEPARRATQHKVENEAKLLKEAEKPLELTIWDKKLSSKNKNKHSFSTLIYLLGKRKKMHKTIKETSGDQ